MTPPIPIICARRPQILPSHLRLNCPGDWLPTICRVTLPNGSTGHRQRPQINQGRDAPERPTTRFLWSKPYQKLGVSTSRQDGVPYQFGSRRGTRRLAVFVFLARFPPAPGEGPYRLEPGRERRARPLHQQGRVATSASLALARARARPYPKSRSPPPKRHHPTTNPASTKRTRR